MTVTLKTAEDIAGMRVAGKLAADVLEMIAEHVKPGVTTEALDRICHDYIVDVQKPSLPAELQRLPQVDLHLDQPCGVPRHSR